MTIKPLNAICVFRDQNKAFNLMEAKNLLRSFNNKKKKKQKLLFGLN